MPSKKVIKISTPYRTVSFKLTRDGNVLITSEFHDTHDPDKLETAVLTSLETLTWAVNELSN